MATPFRAAVVGLGQIGMGYDFGDPSPASILTHAKAFRMHPDFSLVGGVDQDPEKNQKFTAAFGVPAFSSLRELMAEVKPEVVSLCTSTDTHYALCRELIEYKPRLILCEKPVCYSLPEAEELLRLGREAKVPVFVNYMRRFEPGVQAVGERWRGGEFGALQKGAVFYSKGLYNNASHFIDLLRYWLGEAKVGEVWRRGRAFPRHDLEPDFTLEFSGAPVTFQALKEECYSVAELHLWGEKGKLSYRDGGAQIEFTPVVADENFPGYTILGRPELLPHDLFRYQWHVTEEVSAYLRKKRDTISSSLATAVDSLRSVDQIRRKAEQLGES